MNGTKIQFSVAEMELMNNADIILTKNNVIRKIKNLLNSYKVKCQMRWTDMVLMAYHFLLLQEKYREAKTIQGFPIWY